MRKYKIKNYFTLLQLYANLILYDHPSLFDTDLFHDGDSLNLPHLQIFTKVDQGEGSYFKCL